VQVFADADQPSPAAAPTDQRAGHQAGVGLALANMAVI